MVRTETRKKGEEVHRFGEPIIEGWAAIGRELGFQARTVRLFASRSVDPLPVTRSKVGRRSVWIRPDDLRSWAARNGLPS